MKRNSVEVLVGIFVIVAILALILLAFQVSGLTAGFARSGYTITASFDNIGSLKERAPVMISGVKVGQVTDITLNESNFQAVVTMKIFAKDNAIPDDSVASIYTAGLLGSNYINLTPGYSATFLHQGSVIENTHPALVLEQLISQYLFGMKKGS